MHLILQPGLAGRILSDPELTDQGLLSRTLVAQPESLIRTRLIPLEELEAFKAVQRQAKNDLAVFDERITELLDRAPVTTRELNPRIVRLSEDARLLLVKFANSVEADQRPGEPLAEIQGFASKAAKQTARLAGVATVFIEETAASVSVEAMATAIELMSLYIYEGQRLLDSGPVSLEVVSAEKLRDWLINQSTADEVDVRYIVRYGSNAICDAQLVRRLASILKKNGWLILLKRFDNSKRTGRWRVNRP